MKFDLIEAAERIGNEIGDDADMVAFQSGIRGIEVCLRSFRGSDVHTVSFLIPPREEKADAWFCPRLEFERAIDKLKTHVLNNP